MWLCVCSFMQLWRLVYVWTLSRMQSLCFWKCALTMLRCNCVEWGLGSVPKNNLQQCSMLSLICVLSCIKNGATGSFFLPSSVISPLKIGAIVSNEDPFSIWQRVIIIIIIIIILETCILVFIYKVVFLL